MDYRISRRFAEQAIDMPITMQEYEAIETSQEVLLDLLAIEQRYDLLLRNFLDFQRAMHAAASENAVRPKYAPADFDRAEAPVAQPSITSSHQQDPILISLA